MISLKNFNKSFSYSDYPKFLIKPEQRVKFIFLFVALNLLLQQILPLLFGKLPLRFWEVYPQNSFGNVIIVGLVWGLFTGTVQWLLVRQYIPTWHFLQATTLGYCLFIISSELFNIHWNSLIERINDSQASYFYFLLFISAISSILFAEFFYFSQWLVIRKYTQSCRWWLWLPIINSISLLITFPWLIKPYLSYFFSLNEDILLLLPPIDLSFFSRGIWITVHAIAFCLLHKKHYDSINFISNFNSLSIPEITNYKQIYPLKKQIEKQINQNWKDDLDLDCNLTYLIRVNQFGSITNYHCCDKCSEENINLTPILDIVTVENNEPITELKVAFFKVIFSPPGILTVRSLIGLPLFLIFIIALVLIILTAMLIS
jgi:hypothetical protein